MSEYQCRTSSRTLAVKLLNGTAGNTDQARQDLASEVAVLSKVRALSLGTHSYSHHLLTHLTSPDLTSRLRLTLYGLYRTCPPHSHLFRRPTLLSLAP